MQTFSDADRQKLVVTNDGATILEKMLIENPASKIVIDISKSQD